MFKQEARENLLSINGIEMRVNRSSQVEGTFGIIKQDMDYERIRRRGLGKGSAEIMLVSLGYVFRKVFGLLSGKGSIDYWLALEDLMPEKIPELNIDKMLHKKKRVKGKNEALRKAYKRPRRKNEAFLNNIAVIEKANTKLDKKKLLRFFHFLTAPFSTVRDFFDTFVIIFKV